MAKQNYGSIQQLLKELTAYNKNVSKNLKKMASLNNSSRVVSLLEKVIKPYKKYRESKKQRLLKRLSDIFNNIEEQYPNDRLIFLLQSNKNMVYSDSGKKNSRMEAVRKIENLSEKKNDYLKEVEKAKLEKAKLEKAKLEKAKLEKAKLEKAKLEKAKLEKAKLETQKGSSEKISTLELGSKTKDETNTRTSHSYTLPQNKNKNAASIKAKNRQKEKMKNRRQAMRVSTTWGGI